MKAKALTIKQPWAGAIFKRGKNVENRTWATKYRGPLLIHAGAATDRDARIRTGDDPMWTSSSLLGVVDLVDCVQNHPSKWADKGQWHWVLKNPRPLTKPIPMKGKLGLWSVEV